MEIEKQSSVLITGAEGFLGRVLTGLLEHSLIPVIALDSMTSQSTGHASTTTKVVCDITDQEDLERVFRQHDIDKIVHLATVLPTAAQKEPFRATQVNIMGSMNLIELARRFGVRRFVFSSSLSIYGGYPPDAVVSEAQRAAPEDLYGAAKLYVEQLGQAYAASGSLEFVSLRIGRIVGAGARSATSAWRSKIFELLQSDHATEIALPYVASERLLLVHVEDVATAIVTLLRAARPQHAIYNAPCESWTVNDLKLQLESLNPNLKIKVGESLAAGNPRLLDFSRLKSEFGWTGLHLLERLRNAAKKH